MYYIIATKTGYARNDVLEVLEMLESVVGFDKVEWIGTHNHTSRTKATYRWAIDCDEKTLILLLLKYEATVIKQSGIK